MDTRSGRGSLARWLRHTGGGGRRLQGGTVPVRCKIHA